MGTIISNMYTVNRIKKEMPPTEAPIESTPQ